MRKEVQNPEPSASTEFPGISKGFATIPRFVWPNGDSEVCTRVDGKIIPIRISRRYLEFGWEQLLQELTPEARGILQSLQEAPNEQEFDSSRRDETINITSEQYRAIEKAGGRRVGGKIREELRSYRMIRQHLDKPAATDDVRKLLDKVVKSANAFTAALTEISAGKLPAASGPDDSEASTVRHMARRLLTAPKLCRCR